jgi:hypothetical protein
MDKKDEIPLLKIFPKLKKIPRISIINTPTPVKRMVRTSKILGDFNVWIKRDDLTHEQYGGNKPRKYEFVFADALKKKKTRLVMPTHAKCCSIPILDWVSENLKKPLINIMAQYHPDYKILRGEFPEINRRPTTTEMFNVKNYADKLGIFWKSVS